MKPIQAAPAFALLMAFCGPAVADQEAGNRTIVRSSEHGIAYARSVPNDSYGQAGTTRVFRADKDGDKLLQEYSWYANEIYLGGSADATLIRFGPWHRGRKPQEDHLALGIYRDGRVLREYSTLEFQKLGSGVSQSISHYTIFKRQLGFRWLKENDYVYEVEGIDGKVFTFDLGTGALAR
jgi:hypothetical protein